MRAVRVEPVVGQERHLLERLRAPVGQAVAVVEQRRPHRHHHRQVGRGRRVADRAGVHRRVGGIAVLVGLARHEPLDLVGEGDERVAQLVAVVGGDGERGEQALLVGRVGDAGLVAALERRGTAGPSPPEVAAPPPSSPPPPQAAALAATPAAAAVDASPPARNRRRLTPSCELATPPAPSLEPQDAGHGGQVLGQLGQRGLHRGLVVVGQGAVGLVAAGAVDVARRAGSRARRTGPRSSVTSSGSSSSIAGVSSSNASSEPSTLAAKSHRSVPE